MDVNPIGRHEVREVVRERLADLEADGHDADDGEGRPSSVSIEGEGGELAPSLISLTDIKRVIALAKDSKLSAIAFNRAGDLLTVSVSGNAITLNLMSDNYPADFNYLFDKGEPTPMGEIAFNPAFMADYSKINAKSKAYGVSPVKLQFRGANMPIHIILVGDKVKWRALLMPMKVI